MGRNDAILLAAASEETPHKGGPVITKYDLLIINKTDLAAYVAASLEVMARDVKNAGLPAICLFRVEKWPE